MIPDRTGRPTASSRSASRRAWPLLTRAAVLLLAALVHGPAPVRAQATNQITQVVPSTAVAGTTGLLVTFTLDSDTPPAPPAGVLPSSVTIGALSGTSVSHASQLTVTASFDIPAAEPAGARDCAIVFNLPTGGTLTFSIAGGFTLTAPAGPPVVTRQPAPRSVCEGRSASFTVEASGEAPLGYQWQKDGNDIGGATSATYAMAAVSAGDAGSYRCVVRNRQGSAISDGAALTVTPGPCQATYPVVDTGQATCYDTRVGIACPAAGDAFHGQDAQHAGHQPAFTLSADGRSVYDQVTGLTWQSSPDTNGDGSIRASDKLTWAQIQARPAALNAAGYGGYDDWRVPTIKELYSLIDFRGTDPSGYSGTDTSGLVPFIDTGYFGFAYGDTSAGERIIDSQYGSSTLYVSTADEEKLFGVNFADGRIKGYGLRLAGQDKTFFLQCVRGPADYGVNDLVANGDGTVSDRATGLMWSQADSLRGLNWQEALAWVEARNAESWLGHDDWRLPNAKELHSILDYRRSPDTSASAAIDPLFACTPITNEAGQADWPSYWASTTHLNWTATPGGAAVYVAFGRALGYMSGVWRDIHGAGAQRSDPKEGDPANWPTGNGPQGDAIRIYNWVRLVRDEATASARPVLRRPLPDPAQRAQFLPLDPARDFFRNVSAGPLSIGGDALPGPGALIFYAVPDAARLDLVRQGSDVQLRFTF